MPYNTLPNRASDAGPEPQEMDWRDWLYIAEENVTAARRIEADIRFDSNQKRNCNRISAIEHAMNALAEAKELLCK